MRDPARIPRILEALRVEWEKMPDMRLGQLIMNVLPAVGEEHAGTSLFYMEDAELAERVRKFMAHRATEEGK